jgi:hypothetical protein
MTDACHLQSAALFLKQRRLHNAIILQSLRCAPATSRSVSTSHQYRTRAHRTALSTAQDRSSPHAHVGNDRTDMSACRCPSLWSCQREPFQWRILDTWSEMLWPRVCGSTLAGAAGVLHQTKVKAKTPAAVNAKYASSRKATSLGS